MGKAAVAVALSASSYHACLRSIREVRPQAMGPPTGCRRCEYGSEDVLLSPGHTAQGTAQDPAVPGPPGWDVPPPPAVLGELDPGNRGCGPVHQQAARAPAVWRSRFPAPVSAALAEGEHDRSPHRRGSTLSKRGTAKPLGAERGPFGGLPREPHLPAALPVAAVQGPRGWRPWALLSLRTCPHPPLPESRPTQRWEGPVSRWPVPARCTPQTPRSPAPGARPCPGLSKTLRPGSAGRRAGAGERGLAPCFRRLPLPFCCL